MAPFLFKNKDDDDYMGYRVQKNDAGYSEGVGVKKHLKKDDIISEQPLTKYLSRRCIAWVVLPR